jgi:hypothetical protein
MDFELYDGCPQNRGKGTYAIVFLRVEYNRFANNVIWVFSLLAIQTPVPVISRMYSSACCLSVTGKTSSTRNNSWRFHLTAISISPPVEPLSMASVSLDAQVENPAVSNCEENPRILVKKSGIRLFMVMSRR